MSDYLKKLWLNTSSSSNSDAIKVFEKFVKENNWATEFDYANWENELYKLRLHLIKNVPVFKEDEIYNMRLYDEYYKNFFDILISYIEENVDKTDLLKEKHWIVCNFPYYMYNHHNNDYWNYLENYIETDVELKCAKTLQFYEIIPTIILLIFSLIIGLIISL